MSDYLNNNEYRICLGTAQQTANCNQQLSIPSADKIATPTDKMLRRVIIKN